MKLEIHVSEQNYIKLQKLAYLRAASLDEVVNVFIENGLKLQEGLYNLDKI